MSKEPKIFRVPSPGDGRYWEQISVNGENGYVFYSPPDGIRDTERWSLDHFHVVQNDDGDVHYHPVENPLWLLPGEPTEPGETLWEDVRAFVYNDVDFPDDRLYDVKTAWIFFTWIKEAFNVSPYWRYLGTPNTGKTRGLEVDQHLGYRAVLTPSVTEAALYRLIQDYHVTYLLDETESYTTEARAAVQNVLNSGYRRGQQVIRCVNADDGSIIVEGWDVFGPKGLAGTRELKDTLESRCIQVVMNRNSRPVNFNIDVRKAKEIRSRLQLWRFRRLHDLETITSDVSDISDSSDINLGTPPEKLHSIKNSRIVELYAPLIALADNDEARDNIISYAIDAYRNTQEEDSTSLEAEILEAIKDTHPQLVSGKFSTRMVSDIFNSDKPDAEHWKARSVGRVIKRLGFKPKRMTGGSRGWVYDANLVERLNMQYAPVTDEDNPPPRLTSPPSLSSLTSLDYGEFIDHRMENFNKMTEENMEDTP